MKTASPGSQQRFLSSYAQYTQAVVQQAQDRYDKHVRTVDEYFSVRRDTIGAKPSFAILELDLNLPQEVLDHPVIKEMEILSIDMILLGNVSPLNALCLNHDFHSTSRISRATTLSKPGATTITTSLRVSCTTIIRMCRVPWIVRIAITDSARPL